jgi:hypothetical protein
MLIVDDILMFPFKGLLWVFEEIYEAAEQDMRGQAEEITLELQRLYVLLEQSHITEEEFDRRESDLLDRLDQIREGGSLVDEDECESERACNEGYGSGTVGIRIEEVGHEK